MKFSKKRGIGCLFLVIILIFVWIALSQYRHFYNVGNMTFTVWKTGNGYCYITPYKYWSVTIPNTNYIRVPNLGGVNIFILKDSTLVIFQEFIYEKGTEFTECVLSDYKYRFYPFSYEWEYERVKQHGDTLAYYQHLKVPNFDIYVKEMYTITRN